MLRLYRPNSGTLTFEGRDITDLDEAALRPLRARMQIIFQDSQPALNPRLTIGDGRADAVVPAGGPPRGARSRGGVARPRGLGADFLGRYPHQLTAGSASASASRGRSRSTRR